MDDMTDAMTPQQYHEAAIQNVLHELRITGCITKHRWESGQFGRRLAPSIEQLRNAYGFAIEGTGAVNRPYRMLDRRQMPTLVKTTDEAKEAYYNSEHWSRTRARRKDVDRYACVLCGCTEGEYREGTSGDEGLKVHHIQYDLFAEELRHLMTVCDDCHGCLHRHCKMRFPSGLLPDVASRLGLPAEPESWLLPEAVFGGVTV